MRYKFFETSNELTQRTLEIISLHYKLRQSLANLNASRLAQSLAQYRFNRLSLLKIIHWYRLVRRRLRALSK
jgi:hypothetical protein